MIYPFKSFRAAAFAVWVLCLWVASASAAVSARRGLKGGILYAASAKDGAKLAEYKLTAPTVFDGMAVAEGSLYMALKDGSIVCMMGRQ